MGVKIKINKNSLPTKYQKFELMPTSDGISDTVYLLGSEYVLKIYESFSDEANILKLLDGLCVPKVVDEFLVCDKVARVFTQIKGVSTKKYPLEVVKFLKRLHEKTKAKTSQNRKLFTKQELKKMVLKSKNRNFLQMFEKINIELKNDGIIHGDLFFDNAKFLGERLSGVYDFSEACEGDFYFDLAVVVISFGVDSKEVLRVYGAKISEDEFLEYIKFARLYYGISRYLAGRRDYREILNPRCHPH